MSSNFQKSFLCAFSTLLFGACATKPPFKVAHDTARPGTEIKWIGQRAPLRKAESELAVGSPLPESLLINSHMKEQNLQNRGTVRLISVVPSLDTEVCDMQTHLLSDSKTLNPDVERITISVDLPYAQSRFAEQGHLDNMTFLSDYKGGNFGKATGLEIERNNLLARALIVVDKKGVVRHLQITPEIYELPDLAAAISKANEVIRD